MRVILLFSGGLDSLLSYYLLKNSNFEVKAIQFYTPFLHIIDKERYIKSIKKNYGISLEIIDVSREFLNVLINPKFGYGKNLNPCADCKILFLKKAKEIMIKLKYDCIATGEIPGQRPFSQQISFMNLIEKQAGVRGFILRPLAFSTSKLNFKVDEKNFLNLSGRSRKVQLELAKKFNINPIPSPSGGCLLTDPGFCEKVKIVLEMIEEKKLQPWHFEAIKFGRVMKMDNYILIIGRNKMENKKLKKFQQGKIINLENIPSPTVLIFPKENFSLKNEREKIFQILKKYTKPKYHESIRLFIYNDLNNHS